MFPRFRFRVTMIPFNPAPSQSIVFSLCGVLSAAALPTTGSTVSFTDVTQPAGIHFRHNSGAFGKKYLPETLGSGAAFVDVDNDGWQDIFLVNSKNWPGRPGTPSYPALYHNNGNGTFTDITRQAGLAVEMYGMGVAAADYDNDGNADLYVTGARAESPVQESWRTASSRT